jgi:hypothetical protein
MAFEQIIKGTALPKVTLRELFEEDTSSQGNSLIQKTRESGYDSSQITGGVEPFVKISGVILTSIDMMMIDESGFIPTLVLSFTDKSGSFAGEYYPKTNSILELYIKVANEALKPIRCDFLITSVRSIAPEYKGQPEGIGIGTEYIIKGELNIPGIYKQVTKSYANVTSKDALKAISGELRLGFAENESKPADRMTWINPNFNYLTFIQDVISHAYEKEESFFTGFIDKYYYLNYIEVNKQLKPTAFDKVLMNSTDGMIKDFKQTMKGNAAGDYTESFTENYLTTEVANREQPHYILELNLVGDQGKIIKQHGFKKKIHYYNHLQRVESEITEKIVSFYKEAMRTKEIEKQQYLIPDQVELVDTVVNKWMGIDYGNAHPEWNGARLINSQNNNELKKINLKVKLAGINFQVIRGSTIPVFITVRQAEKLLKNLGEETSDQGAFENVNLAAEVGDRYLSGTYYVMGAKYFFDRSGKKYLFYTELLLSRREWLLPKNVNQ